MSKICPICHKTFDDTENYCPFHDKAVALMPLMDKDPLLNLGDANAISGGVNINQSKNITSHDNHYHTTTIERTKSDTELKLDATNQLRAKAEEIMAERGRIDSIAMSKLRPLAVQLGIGDDAFKSIIKDVRLNHNKSTVGLNAADVRYLQQAKQAVQNNDKDTLAQLTHRLEAMAALSQDDTIHYLYYMSLALFDPIKSMEVYEQQVDENYWRTFWAIISYIRTGRHAEAEKILPFFLPLRYEKSQDDRYLLETFYNIIKEDKDGAQVFLDEIMGEPTEQVKPFLRAIETTMYDEEAESLEVRFYLEHVISKSNAYAISQKEEVPNTPSPHTNQSIPPVPSGNMGSNDIMEMCSKVSAVIEPTGTMLMKKAINGLKWFEKNAIDGFDNSPVYYYNNYNPNNPNNNDYSEKKTKKTLNSSQIFEPQKYFEVVSNSTSLSEDEMKRLAEKYSEDAEKGDPVAMKQLGNCYFHGHGVRQDYSKALEWYRKAADAGNAEAMCNLGVCYIKGFGVSRNERECFTWFCKGAKAGDFTSMANVGFCYEFGIGTEAVPVEAMKWYKKTSYSGFDTNEWISERISECNSKLSSPPEVIFHKIWVRQEGKWAIGIHMHLQINNYKDKKVFIHYITELVSSNNEEKGFILSTQDMECTPKDNNYEWKDLVKWVHERFQQWPPNESTMKLKTTIQVLDSSKNPLSTESYQITYDVLHKKYMFNQNELYLVNQ